MRPRERRLTRRGLVKTGAAGALLGVTAACSVFRPRPTSAAPRPVGLQLYTVRDLFAEDPAATLRTVAGVGYTEVEFAGLAGREPEAIRALLDETGLAAPAMHVGLNALEAGFATTAHEAKTLGCRYVVLPWIDAGMRATAADLRAVAATCDRIGARLADEGLRFAFHGHDYAFEPVDGAALFDVMATEVDPARMNFEIDFFWTAKAGRDPRALFAAHPGRFPLAHMKDMTAAGAMTDVGSGVLDFRAWLAHAGTAGLRHFFVEHDDPPAPYISSIRNSFDGITALAA